MPASTNSRTAHAHPVVLLARTVAVILGILAVAAGFPGIWILFTALTGYAVTLSALRGNWPTNTSSTPAAKAG